MAQDQLINSLLLSSTNHPAEPIYQSAQELHFGKNGKSRDYAKAFELYINAAKQNHSRAKKNLSQLYDQLKMIPEHKELLTKYCEDVAINAKNACAQCDLADAYKEKGDAKNFLEAASYYKLSYHNPLCSSELKLKLKEKINQLFHEFKQKIKADIEAPENLFKFYQLCAESDRSEAYFELGCLHNQTLTGFEKDPKKAFECFQKAYDMGCFEACYDLACFYEEGLHCLLDKTKANTLFAKAASQGNAVAQYKLGLFLFKSSPEEKSTLETSSGIKLLNHLDYFQQSAKSGHIKAQCWLGGYYTRIFLENKNLPIFKSELNKGIGYYIKAGLQGDKEAAIRVLELMEKYKTIRLPGDYQCFELAAKSGNFSHRVMYLEMIKVAKSTVFNTEIPAIYKSDQKYLEACKYVFDSKSTEQGYDKADVDNAKYKACGIYTDFQASINRDKKTVIEPDCLAHYQMFITLLPDIQSAQAEYDLGCAYEAQSTNKPDFATTVVEHFENAAKKGHLNSLSKLAALLKENDLLKAADCYSQLSRHKHASMLGVPDPFPKLVEKSIKRLKKIAGEDPKKLLELYKEFTNYGVHYAHYDLGCAYFKGIGVEPDQSYAITFFKKAIQGSALKGIATEAHYMIGVAYWEGKGVNRDYKKALEYFGNSPKTHAESKYMLGVASWKGLGTEKNLKEACIHFEYAAEYGHATAQFMIGCAYLNGQGVTKNDASAIPWLKKSAYQNIKDAHFELAHHYESQKNFNEAVKFYESGAQLNQANCQNKMGSLYEQNLWGIPKDLKEALKWYNASAANGNSEGFLNAARLSEELGDHITSATLYTLAAQKNNAVAQFKLAYLCEQGLTDESGQENFLEAAKYYVLSSLQNYEPATRNLKLLVQTLEEEHHDSPHLLLTFYKSMSDAGSAYGKEKYTKLNETLSQSQSPHSTIALPTTTATPMTSTITTATTNPDSSSSSTGSNFTNTSVLFPPKGIQNQQPQPQQSSQQPYQPVASLSPTGQ